VDDASTDSTSKIIEKFFFDKRIKFFLNSHNIGILKSFERAVYLSQGDVIFFCDQDDVWYKGKRDEMVKSVMKHRIMVAVCDCNIINENGLITSESYFADRDSKPGFLKNFFRNSYLGCGMCFRRELISTLLPFPSYVSMHDEWTGLIGDLFWNVMFVQKQLFGYRRHRNNVTAMKSKGFVFALRKRLFNFFAVASRIHRAYQTWIALKN
jgi:glycosyltransferase involved in cell wall biosynthesis